MPIKDLNHLCARCLGLLCALCVLLSLSAQPAQAASGQRVALLIGNASYSSGLPPLLNPPQDVAALEASLKKLGFRVQVLKDGDQKAMGRAIKQFGTQAQEAQVAFFYYSGHGMQARDENYLIPVGAGIESEADLDIEAVALRSLMRQIDEARPQNAVVVLDACRDNPVAARTKSASKGLSRVQSQPTNTLVVFAALAGNTASDNGVFAKALATHITQPNLGLRGVFDQVNKAVRQASGNKQSIQRDDQLIEDVVLLASVAPVATGVPVQGQADPRPALPRPGQGGGLSLEDLEREEATRKEWAQWQARMKADFDRTVAFKGSADLQAKAWERFLAAWGQDNPLSGEDEGLRTQAQGRIQEQQQEARKLAEVRGGSQTMEPILIKIGHVGPTSGLIAHLGKDNELGARMAIDELNATGMLIGGRRANFKLLTEDDAADPRQGVAAAQRLVNAKVHGVVGHLNSGTSIPASAIYSEAGIPQISPSSTNPKYTRQGYKTTFRMMADDIQLGSVLGKYAVETLKARNVAVIDDRTAYGQGVADAFEKAVTNAGGRIVAREFTHDKPTDFNAILTTIKSRRPDIVFFGGMDSVAGPMLKQMKQLGIQTKFMGGDGICSSDLPNLAGEGMGTGQVFCAEAGGVKGEKVAVMERFRSNFKSKFGIEVQVYAPYVYDAVKVMADAMVRANSPDPKVYLPALAATNNYQGVTGTIAFDSKGDIRNGALTLMTYRNGARTTVDVIR